jgi:hypothetical protein
MRDDLLGQGIARGKAKCAQQGQNNPGINHGLVCDHAYDTTTVMPFQSYLPLAFCLHYQ